MLSNDEKKNKEGKTRFSDPIQVRSRRWTLLCWMTFSFLLLLLILIFPLDLLIKKKNRNFSSMNRSKTMNLFNYRPSLIQCGKSVIREKSSLTILEDFSEMFEEKDLITLNEQMKNEEKKLRIVRWLETLLDECFDLKEYSMNEQEHPSILRRLISFSKKEIFYFIGFFADRNSH